MHLPTQTPIYPHCSFSPACPFFQHKRAGIQLSRGRSLTPVVTLPVARRSVRVLSAKPSAVALLVGPVKMMAWHYSKVPSDIWEVLDSGMRGEVVPGMYLIQRAHEQKTHISEICTHNTYSGVYLLGSRGTQTSYSRPRRQPSSGSP